MVHISIRDPLWEVKTFTYEFWDSVIQKHIREWRNFEELNSSLATLCVIGCLHVSCSMLNVYVQYYHH